MSIGMILIQRNIRAVLLTLLLAGLIGTAVELVLLGHDEGATQIVPLVLIALGMVVVVWHGIASSPISMLAMRVTMVAFIAASAIGIVLHYQGNVEFQKEVDPSMHGFTLFMKAMQSKTPPALAPGVMAHLGVLGLVCTYPFKNRRDEQ
jgi:hypothetical protein